VPERFRPSARSSPAEGRVVVLSSAAHALVHAEMLVFAVVLPPLSAELELSLGEAGLLGTLSYLCFGAGAPAGGWLADRFGSARVLVGCMAGSTASLVLLALSRGLPAAAAAYVLLGLAASLYHPAGLALLSRRVRALGPALAAHGAAGNLGLALAPFAAAALAGRFGWRAPYAALAVLCGVLSLLLVPLDRRSGGRSAADGEDAAPVPPRSRRALGLLLALSAVVGFVYRGSLTFLPIHLMGRLGGPEAGALARAGFVTSAALLAGMAGQWVAGRALESRPAERLLVLTLAAAAPLLAAVALLDGAALIGAVVLFVLVHFANQPLTNSLLARHSRAAVRSRVYGLAFAASFGVGALAAGAGGALAEIAGVPSVFLALAALGVLSLAIGILLAREGARAGSPAVEGSGGAATTDARATAAGSGVTGADPPPTSGW
jgi:predicted MFS family arabinose efflux permease